MLNYTRCLIILLLYLAIPTPVRARPLAGTDGAAGRALRQAVNISCPPGCDISTPGSCVPSSTAWGYVCNRCLPTMQPNGDTGACDCPPGMYASAENTCSRCTPGSYCPGGAYGGQGIPAAYTCNSTAAEGSAALTTLGSRGSSTRSCVNTAGTYFAVAANGSPKSVTCPPDSYGPGLRKQRACVPCPPGYTTAGVTGAASISACVVPEGFFIASPGQVAPCPMGEYKAGFALTASCSKCADGVTTVREASISAAACSVVLPSYYPAEVTDGAVTSAHLCPQKYVCPGGGVTAAFNSSSPDVLTGTTMLKCPDGTWTQTTGASGLNQCMTPPGHYTNTTAGTTGKCPDGYYRQYWVAPAAAPACNHCGTSIWSEESGSITVYDISPAATPSTLAVRDTAAACYIKPGQAMYFSAAFGKFVGAECRSNSYGVTNTTYALGGYPCHFCSTGLQTSAVLAASSAHLQPSGYNSREACVTMKGYGFNSTDSTGFRCPVGSYNDEGNYGNCTTCPDGWTTQDDPAQQATSADCRIAPGYGYHTIQLLPVVIQAVIPCPIGTYNDALQPADTPCTACTLGLTTLVTGAASVSLCISL